MAVGTDPELANTEPRWASGAPGALTGRTLGDFVLRERLGEGGFAVVYRAEQPALERQVVIKVLKRDHAHDETLIARFLREARLASRLDHPYAAHIYSFGAEADGLLWIAMELVRGRPLSEVLDEQGPLPLVRFVPLLERICEVVHTAHQQGIIHRDLKPDNVMVMWRAGRILPKLIDFGIAGFAGKLHTPPGGPTPAREVPASMPMITQLGEIVGTPAYMAPEQWRDSTIGDVRTDLYALGVLCYQCLTGHLPFAAATVEEFMLAHGRAPVPALHNHSGAVHEVLARAMAKEVADRYESVMAFAAAMRTASGLEADPEQLPQLDGEVRELFLAEAPQPLAEGVALLETARSPQSAWDGAVQLASTSIRYLAILALSARSRRAAEPLSGPAETALRALRVGTLDDRAWVTLARELCRPWARRREAHPIRELAALFFDGGGGEAPPFAADLEAWLALAEAEPAADEAALRERLGRGLPLLDRLLRAQEFLCEYTLGVVRRGFVHRWAGVRRPVRSRAELRGPVPADGSVVLLDREGIPVLLLTPLVQALPPSPGARSELFVFEGDGRHGARLLARPQGFERHDPELWTWFGEHILDVEDTARAAAVEERAPYRGLSAFTARDSDLFFGREREAEAFANRLRVQPFLAVVGPSGTGKTSFAQAGVLPLLPSTWQGIVVRPGPAPLSALAAVAGLAASQLAADPAAFGRALRDEASRRGVTQLLVVDQFEEILTLCRDPDERLRAAEAVAQAARSADDPLRVVITLRDDFLIRVQQLAPLRDRLAQGLELLGTPAAADLARILVEPARRVGYELDDAALADDIVRQVADLPGALALLSFTAARLWEQRDRHFRRLSRRAYEQLGGVGGALGRHAEDTLAAVEAGDQPLVRQAFRHLVTAEGTRAVLTRRELLQLLGGGPAAERVLERLIVARLLVAGEGAGDQDRVELIHEALLTSWPRLVAWQREDADSARLRDQLRAAARQWHERGRPSSLLWRDEILVELRAWRSRTDPALTEAEQAFSEASVREQTRAQRRRRALIAGAFAVLAACVVVLFQMNQESRRQQRLAEEQRALAGAKAAEARRTLAASYEEQGRQALLGGDPLRALVHLDQAIGEGAAGSGLEFMASWAAQRLEGQVHVLEHGKLINAIDVSRDGGVIVTGADDGTLRMWDGASGKALRTIPAHAGVVRTVRFAPDGSRFATTGKDVRAKIWDTKTGELLHTLEHGVELQELAFHARGILTVGAEGSVKLWDPESGALRRALHGHQAMVRVVAIDPSGQRAVTGSDDGMVCLWSLAEGRLLRRTQAHAGAIVTSVVFSPDGRRFGSTGFDGSARVWDAETGRELAHLMHTAEARSLAFDAGSSSVVSGAGDRTARVWSAKTGAESLLLPAGSPVYLVAFHPRGDRIVTTGEEGTVQVWDSVSGARLASFLGHDDTPYDLAFDQAGRVLVTGSWDGTARVWDARHSDDVAVLAGHAGDVWLATFNADGSLIATAGSEGSVKVWRLPQGSLVSTIETSVADAMPVAFGPDGTLAVAGPEGAALFEASTGRRFATLESGQVSSVAASHDGTRFVTASKTGSVHLRDAQGRSLRALEGHTDEVLTAAFSPDGRRLVTASRDKTARIWDLESGRAELTLAHPLAVLTAQFSHDGARLATGGYDRLVRIWDAGSGKLLATFEGHAASVSCVDFSPDDRYLASAGHDGTVRIWDVASGRHLVNASAIDGSFYSATYGPDGRSLAVTSRGAVRILRIPGAIGPAEVDRLVACRVPKRLHPRTGPVKVCPQNAP